MTAAPKASGSKRSPKRSGGFTLLELLVAMTLLGILMTALFGSLRLGARVWEASDRVLKDEGQATAIRTFLRDRFEQAMPIVLYFEGGRSETVFSGQRSAIRFASTMPESVGFGPYIIEVAVIPNEADDRSNDLSIRWRLVQTDQEAAPSPVDERILISDLDTIGLAYFGVKRGEEGTPTWHEAWEDQEQLPDLISLDIAFADDDQRRWPPLIVSPKIDEWYDTDY